MYENAMHNGNKHDIYRGARPLCRHCSTPLRPRYERSSAGRRIFTGSFGYRDRFCNERCAIGWAIAHCLIAPLP